MKRLRVWVGVCLVAMGVGVVALAAAPESQEANLPASVGEAGTEGTPTFSRTTVTELQVPRLVRLSGVLRYALDQPRTAVVGLSFAIYQEQEGGAALWIETQNAQLDEQGRYTVLLGSQSSEGLPLEIFSTTEARWLGVTVQGEEEQPRVLLVSVPYALKSADAERLGGQLASTFISRDPESGQLLAGGEVLEASALTTAGEGETLALTVNAGNAGDIVKYASAPDTLGPATTFVEMGGKVGIGTTSPAYKLAVDDSDFTGNDFMAQIRNRGGVASASGLWVDTRWNVADNYVLRLTTNSLSTEVLAAKGNGNVGIGTTAPSFALALNRPTPTDAVIEYQSSNAPKALLGIAGAGNNLIAGTAAGDFAFRTQNQKILFSANAGANAQVVLDTSGRVGIGTASPTYKLSVDDPNSAGTDFMVQIRNRGGVASASGLWVDTRWNVADNYILRLTTNSLSQEVLAVKGSGNVGIGTAAPTEMLDVAGNIRASGDVRATTFTEPSSRRFKDNIRPLPNALRKVLSLRGVAYQRKTDGEQDIGFIAEEVGEVVPEVVAWEGNGEAAALNYSRLTALLVEAVKEQQAQIQRLQTELEALRAEGGSRARGGQR